MPLAYYHYSQVSDTTISCDKYSIFLQIFYALRTLCGISRISKDSLDKMYEKTIQSVSFAHFVLV